MKTKVTIKYFDAFLPVGSGSDVEVGDFFKVTNTAFEDYNCVYYCSCIDSEGRIIEPKQNKIYHHLSICKVELFNCSNQLIQGDDCIVSYTDFYPGLLRRHEFDGRIIGEKGKKCWIVQDKTGVQHIAEKRFVFKKMNSKSNQDGYRTTSDGHLRIQPHVISHLPSRKFIR